MAGLSPIEILAISTLGVVVWGAMITSMYHLVAPRCAREGVAKNTGEECSICLEIIEESDAVYQVECAHEFHAACLKRWVLERAQCPTCRRDCHVML